ncbi:ABC transporter permease [Aggregatibacter actinomycetemcomitans]|uniref:ABC transporter permease n=1 Tax=Aggregatibacter actinomycetemcomitans TaxID=714 RepID=UPI00197BE4A7|nr:ABC transporter permease [Aggregatibacter actinomycetemcomitans]
MESKIKLHNAIWASLVINIVLNIFAWEEYSNYFSDGLIIFLVVVPWAIGVISAIAFINTQKKWALIVLIISFLPFIPAGLLGIWGTSKTMSALNKKIAGID